MVPPPFFISIIKALPDSNGHNAGQEIVRVALYRYRPLVPHV